MCKVKLLAKLGLIALPLISCCLLHANAGDGLELPAASASSMSIDLAEVFRGSPLIYLSLIFLSIVSFSIWIYSLCTLRLSEMMPPDFLEKMRSLLLDKQFNSALDACQKEQHFISRLLRSGLISRKHGVEAMMTAIQAEGRRAGNRIWQRISLLNEIAVIAPMIGLLGTVIGLFFAFYDSNRANTIENLDSIFDGLGMAVGTTVAGLIVAIVAMIFYTLLKFKITNLLNTIESESYTLIAIADDSTNPSYRNPEL